MIPPEENLTFWSASQSASQRGAPDRCAHARGATRGRVHGRGSIQGSIVIEDANSGSTRVIERLAHLMLPLVLVSNLLKNIAVYSYV